MGTQQPLNTKSSRIPPFAFMRRRLSTLLAAGCVLVVLAACSDEEPLTPAPAATATPVAAAVTPTTPVQPSATVNEATAYPYPPPATQGAPVTQVTTATVTAQGATAVFEPLQVDEGGNCTIESHLDLAGYPGLEQKIGCPVEEASLDDIGINEFGPGPEIDRFMLWLSDEGQIYVLFPDNSWQSYADTWTEDQPTFSCNPFGDAEPDSPPLPRRGFGKLWCEQPELQEIMGTVPREERLCQHAVLQRFPDGRLIACFEDATIRYFRLLDNHTWDLVVQ